jgi:hypothetical protein
VGFHFGNGRDRFGPRSSPSQPEVPGVLGLPGRFIAATIRISVATAENECCEITSHNNKKSDIFMGY